MAQERGTLFATRLQGLIDRMPKPDGSQWSTTDIAHALNEAGEPISAVYVRKLRAGEKMPSQRYITAFAKLFGVRPGYFMDDDHEITDIEQLADEVADLRVDDIRRLAVHARGLDTGDIQHLIQVADFLRNRHGLPPVGGATSAE